MERTITFRSSSEFRENVMDKVRAQRTTLQAVATRLFTDYLEGKHSGEFGTLTKEKRRYVELLLAVLDEGTAQEKAMILGAIDAWAHFKKKR